MLHSVSLRVLHIKLYPSGTEENYKSDISLNFELLIVPVSTVSTIWLITYGCMQSCVISYLM